MYTELLSILRCPICGASFRVEASDVSDDEIIEGTLICGENHRYAVRHGVVDFCSEEQGMVNRWSEAYKETDYEALDREIEETKTDIEKQQQQMVIDRFIAELSVMKHGVVVDIASGRGMLITKLAPHLNERVNLIATDLSFEVLKYDRLKLKKANPSLKANYIACDATALPLAAECADVTVSFYGIANMLGIVENGIREAERITKPEGRLLNATLIVKEGSEGIAAVRRVCLEYGIPDAETVYLRNTATELHSRYFGDVCCDIVCEGIKEDENSTDMLPYCNEWYAEVIFRCKKQNNT